VPLGLEAIGERLRQTVQDLKIEHGSSLAAPYVTLSIGGAITVPTQEDGLLDLVAIADRNMYEAKAKGRNKSIVYQEVGGADAT
jgi:diguanylate cyclase (GGDEF)-like protein